jgi:hypothetical protein
MLYALMLPDGRLVEGTVSQDREVTWQYAFEFLSDNGCGNLYGYSADGMELETDSGVSQAKSKYYARRYYGKWKPSMDYARKHGYRIFAVELQLVAVE